MEENLMLEKDKNVITIRINSFNPNEDVEFEKGLSKHIKEKIKDLLEKEDFKLI